MKNYDKCWMKPMVACLMMLQAALLYSAEGDVKIGDANRLEVATSVAKLVFDTSNAPDLRQWTDERFAPTTREWVVKLAGIMASDGWTPPKEIHFQFVADQLQSCKNAAALASAEGNTVSLNADWFRKNLDGEALGATIHVLVRFMQGSEGSGGQKGQQL